MRWSALLLALVWATSAAADEPPIRIRIAVRIAQAPATVNAKIIIAEHPDNRLLVIQLDGENYSLRSDRQLEGAKAARVYDTWWKDLPCGHYEVRAVLVRVENGRQVEKPATERFRVLGFACPDDEEP